MAWTVSVKGVLEWDGSVLLLHNERDEWELPGGQLDDDDASPEAGLHRELLEEVGIDAEVGDLVTVLRYDPLPGRPVLIVVYRCHAVRPTDLWHSHEHDRIGLFPTDELADLPLPDGYRRAIALA